MTDRDREADLRRAYRQGQMGLIVEFTKGALAGGAFCLAVYAFAIMMIIVFK